MSKFQSKNTILTKKLNSIIYELMVKTKSDMVYTDDDTTLTEVLSDISDILSKHTGSFDEIMDDIKSLVSNADTLSNDLKDIWAYVNVDGDPKSALIKMIESKQEAEEGKGLSTCDFTDLLHEKLVNDYTREELDAKFKIIIDEIDSRTPVGIEKRLTALEEAPTATLLTSNERDAESLNNGSIWYKIIKE